MHFWLDGAQNHPQPVEPFVRSIEPPVRPEKDTISPLNVREPISCLRDVPIGSSIQRALAGAVPSGSLILVVTDNESMVCSRQGEEAG